MVGVVAAETAPPPYLRLPGSCGRAGASPTAVTATTKHFGFELRSSAAPAFADVVRGHLRLLLSGPKSSAGRPMPDGRKPAPGGWNRIHFIVDDLPARSRACATWA